MCARSADLLQERAGEHVKHPESLTAVASVRLKRPLEVRAAGEDAGVIQRYVSAGVNARGEAFGSFGQCSCRKYRRIVAKVR